MPASPEVLFQRLDELCIAHKTAHHEALFTVEQSQKIRGEIAGSHNKNLFLRDKKKINSMQYAGNNLGDDREHEPRNHIIFYF